MRGLTTKRNLLLVATCGALGSVASMVHGDVTGISGVVRTGDSLALVSDRDSRVYRIPVPPEWPQEGATPFRGAVSFADAEPLLDQGVAARDLESIEVLPDGRLLVLSERLGALLAEGEILAFYAPWLAPLGGRGLEGLALSASGRLAVLWEGGWLNRASLASSIPGVGELADAPLRPIVCIHELPGTLQVLCLDRRANVALEVPDAPEPGHAFRAGDLVWSSTGAELIVLLASGNREDNSFRYRWLQRFSTTGAPLGAPVNLCDARVLPPELRVQAKNNFEGLAWFDAEHMVIVNDTGPPSSAVLIDVVPWPETDPAQPCAAESEVPPGSL
jgi:hypothetical protein